MPSPLERYTYILRKACFAVQNEVGLARQEPAYHQALKLWFEEHSLPVASKPPHRLYLKGHEAYVLFPDFVGWNSIAVEIKAVPRKLTFSEWVQIRDYMKFRNEELGLLINFGLDRVHIQRIIDTPSTTSLVEDWAHWNAHISGDDRDLGIAIRDALRLIYSEHSTGYGTEVVTRLLLTALQLQGLSVSVNPIAKATFHQQVVDQSPLACLVVNQRFLIAFTALFDTNNFNVSRGLSYMKTLGLRWGVAVNFGRACATFQSLRLASNR